METDFRQLTEETFAAHWEQQLETRKEISPDLARLAERLVELGFKVPVLAPSTPVVSADVTVVPTEEGEIVATESRKLHEYEWESVLPDFRSWLIETLTPVDGKYQLDESTEIQSCRLGWYDEYKLVRLSDPHWINRRLRLYYLTGPNADLIRLNGTSPPIHEVNAKAPIKLTLDNVLSYLVFFCFFVHGEQGPFYVMESMNDPFIDAFRSLPVDPQLLKTTLAIIEGNIKPAVLVRINVDGKYLCSAYIHYSNALFKADFAVAPSGMIEMLNDDPIAADMPTRIEAPLV